MNFKLRELLENTGEEFICATVESVRSSTRTDIFPIWLLETFVV